MTETPRGRAADPMWLSLPGVDRMRALIGPDVLRAPVQHLTGFRLTHVGFGSCTVTMPASPWFQTQVGFFVNGISALVADAALGGAITSVLPPWTFPVTSDINFTYLRPIRVDAERLIAQGRLIEAGRTQATSEATIHDSNGRLLTHATTRCFLRRMEPHSLEDAAPGDDGRYATPDPYDRSIPEHLARIVDTSDLTGLEMLQRLADGSFPSPFTSLFGLEIDPDSTPGIVAARFPASSWFTSPAGTIYGGLLAVIADALNTAAATATLESGAATATLDLKAHFLRPGIADGSQLVGRSEVLHGGKALIVTRADIATADGKALLATTASFMRRQIRDWIALVAE